MRVLSQKASFVLVVTFGLVLVWTLAAGAQLIPKSKEDLERQKKQEAKLLREPGLTPKPAPIATERSGGVIRFKEGKTFKVEVKKPRAQLLLVARREPAMGKGGLQRAFRETLRGASAWERGHVSKIAMRKAKTEKAQAKTENIQEEKEKETQKKE